MSGFTYLINVAMTGGGAFAKLSGQASAFEHSLDQVHGQVGMVDKKLHTMGRTGQAAFSGMRSSLTSFLATLGIAAFTLGSLNTAVDLSSTERAIKFAGAKDGVENLAFAKKAIEDLKLPMQASLDGFKTLTGGMIGSGIAAADQRNLFRAVGEASTVMGLNAEQTNGSLIALAQIASKGKVSAEELRGQLGERIPGAFGIAARAMGVTTQELDKMLERGDLASKDFLPRFAEELHRTFGPGVAEALTGPRAAFNDFNNSIFTLKNTIGIELMPTATDLITNFLVPGATWIGQHIGLLGRLATIIAGVWVAMKIYNVVAAVTWFVTGGWATAVNLLSAAMYVNPIGIIIGAVVAIGAAVLYAWNKFEGFRGFLFSAWEVIKETGAIINDYLIQPFLAFGKTIVGVMTFNVGMIQQGFQDGVAAMQKIAQSPGVWDRLKAAGVEGWQKGVEDFRADNAVGKITEATKAPGAAGALGNTNFGGIAPSAGKTGASDKASKVSSGITGGGSRNVTINISKMTGIETLQTQTMKQGVDQAGDIMLRKLIQIINSANQAQ